MENATILLVEDNRDDEFLTLWALKKSNIGNEIYVVRDGVEALDFLFCTNTYADRDPYDLPQIVLLDIKLPKLDGLEVLRRIRADERTHLLPVVMLTSSNEEQDLIESYRGGSKFLHAQTGELHSIHSIHTRTWFVLAGFERTSALLKL